MSKLPMPKWLDLTKKILTYLLGTTFIVSVLDFAFTPVTAKLILEGILVLLGVLQLICDTFFYKSR